ncbi:hypothetical protein L2K70_16305 [Nocardioides KLBMP 9356]|uniref:Peptidoglycan-binding protein n=1 Tax=Nocardioides potassii TaxID=2911371 RepID=A0ABS9HGA7_9ACTN|nr:hypothetical protein [Nocardioides potassii]MCF6379176.1 hypothetical protein [Nocardioides potassii]
MNDEGLSADEMAAESATALPDKEVVSILDLNADLDLAIDAAAPIDLAVGANANVAAPIDAAVGANVLSEGSSAQALADQGVMINQDVTGDATAESLQDSAIEQGDAASATDAAASTDVAAGGTEPTAAILDAGTVGDTVGGVTDGGTDGATDTVGGVTDGVTDTVDGVTDGTTGEVTDTVGGVTDGATDGVGGVTDGVGGVTDGVGGVTDDVSGMLDGNLLNVNVDLAADADIAAPINGAVAANANVAAPIDAAVSANIGSIDSDAVAVAQQDAIINQNITGDASATADQASEISQPDQPQP